MQWLNSLVSEYEGRPLQKTGMLTKEQLQSFFQESAKQFNNAEFKQLLSVAHRTRGPGSSEDMVNGMQKEIFQSMGIQGDFGINCLSKVNQVYATDAFFMRHFYEHVQKEEMVLDEAEMPEAAFKSKYDQLNRFRTEMEARMAKLKDMTPEEQNAYMSQVYREMIAASSGPGEECCSHPQGCSHRPPGGGGGPSAAAVAAAPLPPGAQSAPSLALTAPVAGPAAAPPALSEDEQLAFFSSLQGAGAGGSR
ncbi:hypothetical protein VOLCADRAFT_120656 [Volvox carteri f. nagariensis]|uniref:Uncharacterized protein n=1 Tax=Volvox carteri f. nagariensis TaxID=3068 RepID=D8TQF9_VOLCA|nr:uncharacterized protein VOLCADRAFT_120656 [Volvox carteri f. nagariensis]EFJ50398.1 hypothetical protein VOLCADRAFT_120656 [Volvox carteri f. nagariensis]|eukprot:XP_002948523.1 hypothetical protein VOLCADRAFT_120656 [Volvox carteri f. nagariensis]